MSMLNMKNRFQNENMLTLLEDLSNELFVEIFSYLTAVDTVFALSNVNQRFQSLILKFCRIFDFKSISKNKFDTIFQQQDFSQWKLLRLSNDNETPGQIEYFWQNYSLSHHFFQLECLSILELKSFQKQKFLSELPLLSNLHSLQIESICGRDMPQFDLPKLKKLVISFCRHTNWFQNFSQIETIEYTIINCCFDQQMSTWPSTIKHLKIFFPDVEDCSLVQHSLDHISQLITLEIYQQKRGIILPDGQIWEQLIRSSLPLLKTFKFYFEFSLYSSHELEQLNESFTTPFYIHEKTWFSHGEIYPAIGWSVHDRRKPAIFYSLPFPLKTFTIYSNRLNNLPCNNIYKNVNELIIEVDREPDQNFNETKIINLIINTNFDPVRWLRILTQLRHLNIAKNNVLTKENLRILMDNTPYLYSLTVKYSSLQLLTNNWTDISTCNLLSQKIHSLKLLLNDVFADCLDRNDLEHIVSIFASKCEHLSVCVEPKINIIDFILLNMSRLKSLYLYIERANSISTVATGWLEKQQTRFNNSNCILVNDGDDYYYWLGKSP